MPIAIQVCCVRRALLFRSSIWHCTASNVLLKLDASHHTVTVLRVLEATCLSNRTSETVEVVKAWCHYCSSKLCLLFDLLLLKSLHPRQLRNTRSPDVFQAVPWTAFREDHMTQLNIWVEYEFCTVHHSNSPEIPLQFVEVLCWLAQWEQTALCAFPLQFCVPSS